MKFKKIFSGLGICVLGAALCGAVQAASGPWNHVLRLSAKDAGVKLQTPSMLAIDAETRRYYLVDAGGGQLVSFDDAGKFLSAFSAGGQLKKPLSMVRTSTGKIWVSETSSNELLYIDPQEKQVRRFGLKESDGTLIYPGRLAVDGKNKLYVQNRMKGNVVLLDDDLKVVRSYDVPAGGKGIFDFKVKSDALWALDTIGKKVYRFEFGGNLAKTVAVEALQFPVSLEIDGAGLIYVLDRHAGTIAAYDASGSQKYEFLGKGKRQGQLWYGTHLLFDFDGRLCVVDEGAHRVEIFKR